MSDEHKRQRVEISQILLHRCQQESDETVDVGPGGDIVPGTSFLNTSSLEMKLITPEHSGDKTRLNDIEAPVLSCHKKVQSPAIGNKSDGHRVL
ncbi:hypothetical protein PoB_002470100 [Plakobranchus ocellatus]|uniref:Uncharacterized protein n=1 Tax=Plakobranchus ocellatus TaxID=259542 RepID=A0AAV3ZG87_9GAST|nr:hypothetical protein PoB_002470100 [Plakobranchus ocellatus]